MAVIELSDEQAAALNAKAAAEGLSLAEGLNKLAAQEQSLNARYKPRLRSFSPALRWPILPIAPTCEHVHHSCEGIVGHCDHR